MVIGGFGVLIDSLTSYYLLSVLTTVFALAGTYFVCFHHKQFESNSAIDIHPNASSSVKQVAVYKKDISEDSIVASNEINELNGASSKIKQDLDIGAEVKKPARIAEMVIKSGMSDEQMQQEKQKKKEMECNERSESCRAQKEQLVEIFKLMQEQADKFGSITIDDIEEQMKLYR